MTAEGALVLNDLGLEVGFLTLMLDLGAFSLVVLAFAILPFSI